MISVEATLYSETEPAAFEVFLLAPGGQYTDCGDARNFAHTVAIVW